MARKYFVLSLLLFGFLLAVLLPFLPALLGLGAGNFGMLLFAMLLGVAFGAAALGYWMRDFHFDRRGTAPPEGHAVILGHPQESNEGRENYPRPLREHQDERATRPGE